MEVPEFLNHLHEFSGREGNLQVFRVADEGIRLPGTNLLDGRTPSVPPADWRVEGENDHGTPGDLQDGFFSVGE